MLLTLRGRNVYATARSTADSVISALSPAAWYRNGTDVISSGGFASIWADYASSDVGLVLPGVAGNSATTPDAAPLDIVGDIDVICRAALTDWTPSSAYTLICKDQTSTTTSFRLDLSATTGVLTLVWSTDGAVGGTLTANSTAATGVTDGAAKWVRATLDVDDGGGNRVIKFYTSDDGTSWAQLGTTVTAAGTTSIYSGNSQIEVGGARNKSAQMASGTIYRAIIKNGIDGTTVFDADFSAQSIGAASFTESSSNAATVTINTSGALPAHIGKARDLCQGTGTNQPAYANGIFTFDGVDNYMKASAFTLNQPTTVVAVLKQIAWTINDSLYDGNTANTGLTYQAGSSPNLVAYAGAGGVSSNPDAAIGSRAIMTAVFNGASSAIYTNLNAAVTGNAGTGNMGGFTLGALATPALYANASFEEVVVFPAALTGTQVTNVVTALNNALTVF